ncbi:MAG: molybdate ABC transporter substrate-binding protein [Mailhella sp.]|nr:molybdate ABC transporter substrate-binding protein [Mailhella sp.]
MLYRLIRFAAFSLFLLMSSVCSLSAAEITVSAAASLSNAFTMIARDFSEATGIKVNLNFASSNNLLRQMQSGAPVDVFASADQKTMDMAAESKLIRPETRTNFAKTDLVLITPVKGTPASSPADLRNDSFGAIAIGTPKSVPAGRYAQEALTHEKLWQELSAKFIFGNNVRQVLSYVQQGEADAGIVYRTDALTARDKVRIDAVLKGHTPVTYPIALTADSAAPEEARRFLEYVLSPAGQKVLTSFGFDTTK